MMMSPRVAVVSETGKEMSIVEWAFFVRESEVVSNLEEMASWMEG